MTKLTLSILFLSLFSISVFSQSELPTTEIRNLQNQKVEFNTLFEKGKVTLVSFWATWCVPCKKEIRAIKENMPTWKEEADFNYMTISQDDSRASGIVKSYVASQKWDFPTYIDPNGDLKRSLSFQNIPFTIIVDGEGKIVYQHSGYEEGGEAELFEIIKKYSAKKGVVEEAAPVEAPVHE